MTRAPVILACTVAAAAMLAVCAGGGLFLSVGI